jgi:hypothetical protein
MWWRFQERMDKGTDAEVGLYATFHHNVISQSQNTVQSMTQPVRSM